MTFLNKTGVALRLLVAISLIAITSCSSPPSRTVEAPKTCVPNYTGETNDAGRAHGIGDGVWANCDKFSGLWSDDSHVDSTYIWPDGGKFEGKFKDDHMYIGYGDATASDGRKIRSPVVNGKVIGQGTLVWPDGDTYEGQFENGDPHRQGTHSWANGELYQGQFENGKQDG